MCVCVWGGNHANKTLIKTFKIKIHFLVGNKAINLRLFQYKQKKLGYN